MNCQVCGNPLSGRQTKFCSNPKCQSNRVYSSQQARGRSRRNKLIELKGGKCGCGYNKCSAALNFHHRNPKTKKFKIDIRACSNHSWEVLIAEAKKCDLQCANCHIETHWGT